jgi:hypothetical protein
MLARAIGDRMMQVGLRLQGEVAALAPRPRRQAAMRCSRTQPDFMGQIQNCVALTWHTPGLRTPHEQNAVFTRRGMEYPQVSGYSGGSGSDHCKTGHYRPAHPSTRGSSTRWFPSALHTVEQYANNPIEADHERLKARLRPMRGVKRHRSARILAAGHAFVQNLRRGHYDIATHVPQVTGSAQPSTSSL